VVLQSTEFVFNLLDPKIKAHKFRQFSHAHDLILGLDIQLNSLLSFTPKQVPLSH
jgi:hypothetical protein